MPICKLCLKEVPKLAESHIIPKAFHKDMIAKEPMKLFYLLSSKPSVHKKRSRTGVYDEAILCPECEAKTSPWDGYAYNALYQSKWQRDFFHEGKHFAERLDGADKSQLLLFFVSLLWRMSVTNHEVFRLVKTGNFEELLRDAVLVGIPTVPSWFDVILSKFGDGGDAGYPSPHPLRQEQVEGYRVCFPSYMCWIKLDHRPTPEPFASLSIFHGEPVYALMRDFSGSPEQRALLSIVKRRNDAGVL